MKLCRLSVDRQKEIQDRVNNCDGLPVNEVGL